MDVSQKIGGKPPKWMVYNGNPYSNGWFGGKTHYFRKPPYTLGYIHIRSTTHLSMHTLSRSKNTGVLHRSPIQVSCFPIKRVHTFVNDKPIGNESFLRQANGFFVHEGLEPNVVIPTNDPLWPKTPPTQWTKAHLTLPETNIAPENGWLEYYFPIGEAYFQGLC